MTRLVSAIDSPFAIDENVKPVVSQTAPPRRQKAAPKLTRVRGAGLEEEVAEHRALEDAGHLAAVRDGLHRLGHPQQRLHRLAVELGHGQQVGLARAS